MLKKKDGTYLIAAPSTRKCMICRERTVSPTTLDSYATDLEHDGRKYAIVLADFPVLKCRHCGEIYLDEAADEKLSEALLVAIECQFRAPDATGWGPQRPRRTRRPV